MAFIILFGMVTDSLVGTVACHAQSFGLQGRNSLKNQKFHRKGTISRIPANSDAYLCQQIALAKKSCGNEDSRMTGGEGIGSPVDVTANAIHRRADTRNYRKEIRFLI